MKYIDEFRDSDIAKYLVDQIHAVTHSNWVLMELCGGQTHTIVQYGIDQILPAKVEMVHGPGCPVCVTPLEVIDQAIAISGKPNVIFTSFGDMLRVPGSASNLLKAKSEGADVRIVYSPLEALKIAKENPDKEVVFFAIGFETTAPGNAMALLQAHRAGIKNFSEIASHVMVPPAMKAILSSPSNRVNGFLAAGHVCTVMGYWEYEPVAEKYNVPIVPTGFEPVDILEGIYLTIKELEEGNARVVNQYKRSITREGNKAAQEVIAEVFKVTDKAWRGIGVIPASGYEIRDKYRDYNAAFKFDVQGITTKEPEICISGEILQGMKKPDECPAFGTQCTPAHPLGATMVSGEGACAAYHKYHRYSNREVS